MTSPCPNCRRDGEQTSSSEPLTAWACPGCGLRWVTRGDGQRIPERDPSVVRRKAAARAKARGPQRNVRRPA